MRLLGKLHHLLQANQLWWSGFTTFCRLGSMSCSLISEKPLLVNPSLAATIGLEEATLLAALDEWMSFRHADQRDGFAWLTLTSEELQRRLSFWTVHDIQRVAKSLYDKGIVLIESAPLVQSQQLIFAFNSAAQNTSGVQEPAVNARNNPTRGANRISPMWQPSDDVYAQLAQHNIPRPFIQEQIAEFVTYWRERDEPAHAWGAKFLKQVIRAWRNQETRFHRKDQEMIMDDNWQPSLDALEVLVKHASINQSFVEDAIPEFVLYWQERGEKSRTWNSKFIQHVRRQWNRYTATVENETVPKPLPKTWQPSADLFDVLRLANIDTQFAKQQVAEFVLYWSENGAVNTSWNTKFLQHVKYHWARRLNLGNPETGNSVALQNATKTRTRSLVDDLTDRSWAN